MQTTLEILLISWAMISLSLLIITRNLPLQLRVGGALVVLALGSALTLFYGFLLQMVMNNLGGKGHFYQGLTALTLAKFPLALGFLLASIFLLVNIAGVILALIVLLVFVLNSISILYRSVKEFFGVDMVVAWIGIGALILGTIVSIYILGIGAITANQDLFMNFMRFRMLGY